MTKHISLEMIRYVLRNHKYFYTANEGYSEYDALYFSLQDLLEEDEDCCSIPNNCDCGEEEE